MLALILTNLVLLPVRQSEVGVRPAAEQHSLAEPCRRARHFTGRVVLLTGLTQALAV